MDPLETGKLLIMLAGLAGLYLKVNQAMRTIAGKGDAREITNDPLNVREAPEYMTRRESSHQFAMFEARILAVERRLDKDLAEMRVEIGDLHEKINAVAQQNNNHHAEVMRAIGRLEGNK